MTAPTQDALDGPPCVDAFACEAPAVARALAVDPASGLTEDEAVRRRARVGDNTVPTEPPRSLVRSVVAELHETMILVLLAAAVLTAVSGDFSGRPTWASRWVCAAPRSPSRPTAWC